MQFVIAGNYHEYLAFLERKGLPRTTQDYIFISDPTRLYGMHRTKIICTGHYWLSPVCTFKYLEDVSEERHIRFVDDSEKELNADLYDEL